MSKKYCLIRQNFFYIKILNRILTKIYVRILRRIKRHINYSFSLFTRLSGKITLGGDKLFIILALINYC